MKQITIRYLEQIYHAESAIDRTMMGMRLNDTKDFSKSSYMKPALKLGTLQTHK